LFLEMFPCFHAHCTLYIIQLLEQGYIFHTQNNGKFENVKTFVMID